jgi:hypothetical protein
MPRKSPEEGLGWVISVARGPLTGGWSVLTGVALTQAENTPWWSGAAGTVIGALLMICSLEFVGGFEREGWKLAGVLTPIAYVAWSLWLIVVGVGLVL